MTRFLASLSTVLIAALISVGIGLYFLLVPVLGSAGAALSIARLFLLVFGLIAWTIYRRIMRRESWALMQRQTLASTIDMFARRPSPNDLDHRRCISREKAGQNEHGLAAAFGQILNQR